MDKKKKIIIFGAVGVLLVILIIVGLFMFLNRNKDPGPGQLTEDPNQTIQTTPDPVDTPTPTPDKPDEPIPSYLDMYTKKTLPGVEFNVPKSILEKGTPIEEIEGTLNGKTAIYETQNTFAMKKIGSFMMGLVPYEKAGVYDSIYVSSITGAKKMQVNDDFAFSFDDFNFNSTSFVTSRGEGQKKGVIAVQMVEPEYTNDVYEGYVLLTVNAQNQGYIAFVVTTGTEIMPVDVQSMINHISLTGDAIQMEIIPPEPEMFTLSFNMQSTSGGLIPQTGEVLARNQESGEIVNISIVDGKGEVKLLPGTYDILGSLSVKTTEEAEPQTLRVKFDNNTITLSQDSEVLVELDNQLVETFENPDPKGWLNVSFVGATGETVVDIIGADDAVIGTLNINETVPSSMLILPAGEYKFNVTVNGELKVEAQAVIIGDLGKTDIMIDIAEEVNALVSDVVGVLNIAPAPEA